MLYRIIGLLMAVIIISYALSWYVGVPVLAMYVKFVLLLRAFKWSLIWNMLRTYIVKRAPIQILYDIPTRLLRPLLVGVGLEDISHRISHRFKLLWQHTGRRLIATALTWPLTLRLLASLALTVALVMLSMWNNWFLLLIVFMPSEVTNGLSLFVSRYISRKLANTAFLKLYYRFVDWLLTTSLGRWLAWINDRYEQHLGHKLQDLGERKRHALMETPAGRTFMRWIDTHLPTPPLLLESSWRINSFTPRT